MKSTVRSRFLSRFGASSTACPGEYIVIGKVLASATDYDGFDFTDLEEPVNQIIDIKKQITPLLRDMGIEDNPHVFVFSHYS